ncbi:MAG: ABC transporter permease [Bryobacteraceae bacterium]
MNALWQDFRFALRSLATAPVFTAVALLSLALGIGANTAIFSLIDQLLLRSLPVRDPQQLVQIYARGSFYGSNWGSNTMSYPMYRDFRDHATVFDGLLMRRQQTVSVGHAGQVERARAEIVSGNYFQTLGVNAAYGRTLLPEDDDKPGAHPVAVLAYDYWKARFGGQPDIIGRSVVINDLPFTVIGVIANGFSGMEVGTAAQVFAPIAMQDRMLPGRNLLEDRRTRWANVFGRLKPGISVVQAQAAVQPLFNQILEAEVKEKAFAKASKEDMDAFLRSRMNVTPGGTGTSSLRSDFGPALWVLLALVGVVLLIACANVANLQLARASARQKEVAVRLAIGASRWQIMRQLLVESGVLAFAAGLLGLLLGQVSTSLLLGLFRTDESHMTITSELDARVLLFTFGISILVGALFGLVPAVQATHPKLAETLKDQAGSVTGGAHSRFRKALVAAQVTLSLMLLIGAGLFVNSLYNLKTLDPGFRSSRLLVFGADPLPNGYSPERMREFYRTLHERLSALPGIEAVSSANMAVVSGDNWDSGLTIEGQDPSRSNDAWAFQNHLTPGYFRTLGAEIKAGRDFTWADRIGSPEVAMVNETFAKEYFPGQNPIGRHVGMGTDPGTKTDIEIVGVVSDFKYKDMSEKIGRQMFRPLAQMPFGLNQYFYVRTSGEPKALFGTIRNEVRKLDANLPIYGLRTVGEQVELNLATQRLVASLSACFGALATLLAVIGLYGVMAYLVGRRSREIGIRMALGASEGNVVWMILREVLLLIGIGVALGLAGALSLTRFVQAQLFGVTASDPRVLAVAAIGLAGIALLAGYIPARRAANTDPLRVLRYE